MHFGSINGTAIGNIIIIILCNLKAQAFPTVYWQTLHIGMEPLDTGQDGILLNVNDAEPNITEERGGICPDPTT